MVRWILTFVAIVALGLGNSASAGNWSIGYSDYGHHGGYSVQFGRSFGHDYSAFSWSPGWNHGGYGYASYGYRDPWFVGGYRAPVSYYGGCYYGCGRVRYGGYYAPSYSYGYYGYRPAYSYGYRPSYGYRYYGRGYGHHDNHRWRGDNHHRNYGRHSYGYYGGRDDHRSGYRYASYDQPRHQGGNDYRRSETAYERARSDTYNANDDAWRGQRGRE